jgi:hypothetical protein
MVEELRKESLWKTRPTDQNLIEDTRKSRKRSKPHVSSTFANTMMLIYAGRAELQPNDETKHEAVSQLEGSNTQGEA